MTDTQCGSVIDWLSSKAFNLRACRNEAHRSYCSPKFMGVNKKVVLGNVVFCVLVSIVIGILIGISLLVMIHLLVLRLSFKMPGFMSMNPGLLTMAPPMMNRWYLNR